MDLSRVPGVTPESKTALEAAGVRSAAELARVPDVGRLAEATSLPVERLEGLREAARAQVVARLREAGVQDEAALAAADTGDLAARTGLERADVEWFQAAARETLAGLPPTRVTLKPGAGTARVRVEGEVFEGVPVRTAKADESPFELLAMNGGNLVVLQPGHATTVMRVAGATHEAVPLFAGREGASEVAVRVVAVREADVAPVNKRGGLLSRFRLRS